MKYFFKYLLIIPFIFSFNTITFAVDPTPPPASAGMRWFCLSAPKAEANPGQHTARLYTKAGSGYIEGNETSVVVRIAYENSTEELTAENSAMTTGNRTLDQKILGGSVGLDALITKLGFEGAGIVGGTNPTNSFPVTWKDDLSLTSGADDRAHYWYGVQETVIAANGAGAGNVGAQQQATFDFAKAQATNDCDIIRWDPFGYVFDAQTHGAIEGVYVRILTSKTENGVYVPVPVGVGIGKVPQNPIATQKDGSYRYYVDPGYYKLELLGDTTQSNKKYVIERDIKNIKPGYNEFGYEQIYIAETPEVIHELSGKVERRDIAIETIGAPAPFSKDGPKLKDLMVNRAMKNGEQKVRITGMVSQIPVNLSAIYKDVRNVVVGEEKFSVSHGHKYVPAGLHDERNFDIWVNAKSKDGRGIFTELRISSKYSTKTSSVAISPMPTYLDGIAQTKIGTPIVGGIVGVYPVGSNVSTYEAFTDNTGRFIVNTEWIPLIPYELRYTTVTGDKIKVTTSEYLKQNASYHKENLVDSYAFKVAEMNPRTAEKGTGKTGIGSTPSSRDAKLQPTVTQTTGLSGVGVGVLMTLMIVMMIIAIGVGAFILIRSKQSQITEPLT